MKKRITRDNGYFCLENASGDLLQGEFAPGRPPEIHVKSDWPVVIDKMFGPLIFQCIQITADPDSGDWVVERETRDGGWEVVARFPGQTPEFFDDRGES